MHIWKLKNNNRKAKKATATLRKATPWCRQSPVGQAPCACRNAATQADAGTATAGGNVDPALPRTGGRAYLAAKRAFDVAFSAAACVLLAVPVALTCAAIRLDSPGSPVFLQERVGQGGRPIRILKLRTMVADAHERPERYMTPEQLDVWRREQKLDGDPRVTRVGRILRRMSLDEMPQFLNVLKGDLSVIGPRPVTEEETWEFGEDREEFLSCKPGITGWWQVTDRNDATWESGERQARELFYVRHQCAGLDARVLARTFKAMWRGK